MPAYHIVHIVKMLLPFPKTFSMLRSLLFTHDSFYLYKYINDTKSCKMKCIIFIYYGVFFALQYIHSFHHYFLLYFRK